MRGEAAGAERALRAALAIHPGFAAARADLGWALLRLGRAVEADAEFARALELDPLHALPREQLAWRELVAGGR
jgi:Flp pilus assembly protein TadD